ncbi:glucose/ribitol dehydrogenase family protein [Neocallimastix lanati (nom. inval.)]|nr:glucose/ribitol dehydrogenase family protein [Neocallimastix sp. JGI-2020a]
MPEKVVLITGATSGLGLETAKKVAKQSQDFHIIIPCRNIKKGEAVKQQIIEYSGNSNIDLLYMDLSDISSIKPFVEEFKKLNKSIYALVCNAGISRFGKNEKEITAEGFDIIFVSNHLGHFLLTKLLLPFMEKKGKIFYTSSDMHNPPPSEEGPKFEWIGVDALAHPDDKLAVSPQRYAYSKLFNLYYVYELTRRLKAEKSEILVNAFNPGLMRTHLVEGGNDQFYEFIRINVPERYGDLDKSSSAYAELIYSNDIVLSSGHFYDRSVRPCFTSPLSYNEENAKELWEKSEEYLKSY